MAGSMKAKSRLPARLAVVTLATWHGLRGRGRRRPPVSPRRILIAHHLLLGDTLMLTPLLAKLRERYPAAEIVMATPAAIAPLYQHRPYGVIAVPHDPRDPATLKDLFAKPGFDLAVVPGDNRFSWLARALDARWIVAFAGDRPAYKSWPVDDLIPYSYAPGAWGDMVADLIPGPPPAPYRPADWRAPDCRPFDVPSAPFAVLHVGASTPLKLWPAERWRTLAAHLEARGFAVVLSAGPGEEQLVTSVDPAGKYRACAGTLDLAQLWRLLAGAGVLVCPDTGIAHLGRIVGVPTVTLFGPGSRVLSGAGAFWCDSPYRAVTVEPFPCRNQHLAFKRELAWLQRCHRGVDECNDNRCMQVISPAQVISALDELSIY
jgi:ADP-heptose:LPS heptosyltransferase